MNEIERSQDFLCEDPSLDVAFFTWEYEFLESTAGNLFLENTFSYSTDFSCSDTSVTRIFRKLVGCILIFCVFQLIKDREDQ